MGPAEHGRIEISSLRVRQRSRLLTIDGLEIRRTSSDALKMAAIEPGDTPSEADIHRLLDEAEPQAAMNRALRLLGHRDRSCYELTRQLEADGYPSSVTAEVLERLSDYGYLDDARFAHGYARAKRGAGWGRRRIENGLAEKGISDDDAFQALETHVPVSGEKARAEALLARADVHDRASASRALRRLVGRGFGYDAATAAVRAALQEDGDALEQSDS